MKERLISRIPLEQSLPPRLPSGYTYAHYDMLGSLCRAHTSWCGSVMDLPPYLDSNYSNRVLSGTRLNERLGLCCRAVAALSPQACGRIQNSESLVTVLMSLSHKVTTTPSFLEEGSATEDKMMQDYVEDVIKAIESGRPLSLYDLSVKISVSIGNTLVLRGEIKEPSRDPQPKHTMNTPVTTADSNSNQRAERPVDSDAKVLEVISVAESDDDLLTTGDSIRINSSRAAEVSEESEGSEEGETDDELFTAEELAVIENFGGDDQTAEHEEQLVEDSESEELAEVPVECVIIPCTIQRRSTRRGSEDALITSVVMKKLIDQLGDVEALMREEEPNDDTGTPTNLVISHLSPSGTLFPVVKACVPRFPDDVDPSLWQGAFEKKLTLWTSVKRDSSHVHPSALPLCDGESPNDIRCAWCKCTEMELCSQLVIGQTMEEWVKWIGRRREAESNPNANLTKTTYLLTPVYSPHPVPLPTDVEIEFVSGSIIVHEICAEVMLMLRDAVHRRKIEEIYRLSPAWKQEQARLLATQAFADVSCGLLRERVLSIGRDERGGVYYAFPGSSCLYIGRRGSVAPAVGDEVCTLDLNEHWACLPPDLLATNSALSWIQCKDTSNIVHVMRFLNPESKIEKTLLFTLCALFPHAAGKYLEMKKIDPNIRLSLVSGDLVDTLRLKVPQEFQEFIEWDESATVDDELGPSQITVPKDEVIEDDDDDNTATGDISMHDNEDDIIANTDEEADAVKPDEKEVEHEAEFEEAEFEAPTPPKRKRALSDISPEPSTQASARRRYPSDAPSDQSIMEILSSKPSSRGVVLGSAKASTPCYQIGAKVLVRTQEHLTYWEGKVTSLRTEHCAQDGSQMRDSQHLYKIRYIGWGAEYDSWVGEDYMLPSTQANRHMVRLRAPQHPPQDSLDPRPESIPDSIPEILKTLRAYAYYDQEGRHNESHSSSKYSRTKLPFPCHHGSPPSDLSLLKACMLLVQSSLPGGSLDEGEEKWGRGLSSVGSGYAVPSEYDAANVFTAAWRHAVLCAPDSSALMECQLMLEYGIRSQWLKATGVKFLSCLPSRFHAVRHCTLGAVAIRLWCLDQAVKYEKVDLFVPSGLKHEGEEDQILSQGPSKKKNAPKKKSAKR
jgi:hypothetical protein